MTSSRRAFTLIELLVVIVIITILASLLLTGISAAMRMAKKTKATATVNGITAALNAYYTEYHKWPTVPAGSEGEKVCVKDDIAMMLQGDNLCPAPSKTSPGGNPKRMAFMQFQTLAKDSAGKDDPAKPVNPWWHGDDVATDEHWFFFFKFDDDFDNLIKGTDDPNDPPEKSVKKSVIAWTEHWEDKKFVERIKSWE